MGTYSGQLKKTFKIRKTDISDNSKVMQAEGMKEIVVPYSKTGASPYYGGSVTAKFDIQQKPIVF